MTHFPRFSRSLPALLVAGALSTSLLASCGGGGSGGSSKNSAVNSATPVPTTASAPMTSCNNSTFTPNYASSVSLLHWQKFPLSIFFVQDDQLSASRRDLALSGFKQWLTATGNRADTTVVSSATNANVTVSFYKFTGGSGDTLGTTTVSYDSSNTIRKATVELGVTGNNDEDISTAAHEFGHVLGITGHSPSDLDLMYYTGNLSGEITKADLNTVLTAYCDNFNRSSGRTSAAVGPLKTIVIH